MDESRHEEALQLVYPQMAAAITKISNASSCSRLETRSPNSATKNWDQELVGLLEWSLPSHWRKKFDLDEYIPTLGTRAKLIFECKAIERNKSVKDKERKDNKDNNNNNNNNKKNKFRKFNARAKKDDRLRNIYFFCKNCRRNPTNDTSKYFF
jgi:hypothetical protein